jgi:parallel beta-helix repeat protein
MKQILFIAILSWSTFLHGNAATYIVSNTNNAGAGSLHQAILDANANAGADVINFNIPGTGPFTIAPTAALPNITDAVTIDALSQPGASAGSPNVVLSGANAPTGLVTSGSNSSGTVIKGLVINGFSGYGIIIGSNNNVISSCFIGTDVTGTSAVSNNWGIFVNSSGNVIGGNTVADRNVISGNSAYGIQMTSIGSSCIIKGNYIGINATGTTALGNALHGIATADNANNNTIEGNVISGNGYNGIELSRVDGTIIKGNKIGTNATGNAAISNGTSSAFSAFGGIALSGATNTIIGGSNSGEGNLISGNVSFGVSMIGVNSSGVLYQSTGNIMKGNYVGTNATGTVAIPNGVGVVLGVVAANNTIGGVGTGDKNVISGNSGAGVYVAGGANVTGNNIRGNNISANGGLGIDLQGNGVDNNDAGDGDTGPNDLQNYPILTGVYTNLAVGTFNSTPSSTFTLDFYSNASADPSGHGEGQTYLGSTTLTTDASGNASFSFSGTFTAGTIISATATNAVGSTSEFSGNQTVQNAMPVRWLSTTATLNTNKTVSVNWETADEVQNKGFEVERSSNAKSFERINTTPPLGAGGLYQFIDIEPLLGVSYYRIKQLDNDGSFSYSRIVSVVNDTGIGSFPNPTTDKLTITMPQGLTGSAQLTDINGRSLKQMLLQQSQQTLKLDNMTTGTYFLTIYDDRNQILKMQKVVKQ